MSDLEGVELPPYEAVVVRVDRGRHERPPPVHRSPELVHVVAAPGREVLEPLHRVREARDLVLCGSCSLFIGDHWCGVWVGAGLGLGWIICERPRKSKCISVHVS